MPASRAPGGGARERPRQCVDGRRCRDPAGAVRFGQVLCGCRQASPAAPPPQRRTQLRPLRNTRSLDTDKNPQTVWQNHLRQDAAYGSRSSRWPQVNRKTEQAIRQFVGQSRLSLRGGGWRGRAGAALACVRHEGRDPGGPGALTLVGWSGGVGGAAVTWIETAEEILDSLARSCQRISGAGDQ
jgi:hypothetical protein